MRVMALVVLAFVVFELAALGVGLQIVNSPLLQQLHFFRML
jgi:hypothetical protein